MLKILLNNRNDRQLVLNRRACKSLLFYLNNKSFIRSFTKATKKLESRLILTRIQNELKLTQLREFHRASLLLQQRQGNRPEPPDFTGNQSSSDQNNPPKDDKGDKDENDKQEEMKRQLFTFFVSTAIFFGVYQILKSTDKDKEGNVDNHTISWNEFVNLMLAKGEVKKLTVIRERELVVIELHPGAVIKGKQSNQLVYFLEIPPDQFEEKLRKVEDELNIRTEDRVPVVYRELGFLSNIGIIFVLAMLVWTFSMFATKKSPGKMKFPSPNDMFSQFGKARFTMVDPSIQANVPKVTFKDVAGLKEAKVEVMEFVQYLKQPERFQKLGAKVPKGALLLGPPGCGKTLLAKALAAEAGVPFFSMAGTEFIEVIGGVGAARVRDLFKEARKFAPSIVFVDEIDAIGKKRSNSSDAAENSEGDQTLNQLLSEMDGLESKAQVIVLASTNRPDVLDKALTRPGRLDRKIMIDLPTYSERIEILDVNLQKLKLEASVDKQFVADLSRLTARMSGADLANVCNEAALHAARDLKNEIQRVDFEAALEKIMSGSEKKSSSILKDDQKLIAYYECGRVLMSWLLDYGDLLYRVSLVPRTKTLALAHYLPSENKLLSKEELFDRMCMRLGGRVAETIVFNSVTTRSRDDLQPVTKLAYAQVQSYGMSDKIGQLSFPTRDEQAEFGMVGSQPFSKKLKNTIDQEASKLVADAHKRTEKMLKENISSLHKLTEELLKKETLNFDEIVKILGPPKSSEKVKRSGSATKPG